MADQQLIPYEPQLQAIWDTLINRSRNGTFLLTRPFMDYHADRFHDCSLLFLKKGRPIAAFAANHDPDTHTIYAHQGLTYGGLILAPEAYADDVLCMQSMLETHYRRQLQATTLIVKPVPTIYHTLPTEEPLYALFRSGAQLTGRSLSSALPLPAKTPMSTLRKRAISKAQRANLIIRESTTNEDIAAFHTLLTACLAERHGTTPVHTAAQMQPLMQRFPNNISLLTAHQPNSIKPIAGIWLFRCQHLLHTQYLATNTLGRQLGALDLLVHHLISQHHEGMLDFGISTLDGGRVLNSGLAHQKEGFGGRGICYDTYTIHL